MTVIVLQSNGFHHEGLKIYISILIYLAILIFYDITATSFHCVQFILMYMCHCSGCPVNSYVLALRKTCHLMINRKLLVSQYVIRMS
jgi:hypothetical protein